MAEDWTDRRWLESEQCRLVSLSPFVTGRPIQARLWKQRLAMIEQRLDELADEEEHR